MCGSEKGLHAGFTHAGLDEASLRALLTSAKPAWMRVLAEIEHGCE